MWRKSDWTADDCQVLPAPEVEFALQGAAAGSEDAKQVRTFAVTTRLQDQEAASDTRHVPLQSQSQRCRARQSSTWLPDRWKNWTDAQTNSP